MALEAQTWFLAGGRPLLPLLWPGSVGPIQVGGCIRTPPCPLLDWPQDLLQGSQGHSCRCSAYGTPTPLPLPRSCRHPALVSTHPAAPGPSCSQAPGIQGTDSFHELPEPFLRSRICIAQLNIEDGPRPLKRSSLKILLFVLKHTRWLTFC